METEHPLSKLSVIGTDRVLVPSFGNSALNSADVVPFAVLRQQTWKWPYNLVQQAALSAALAKATNSTTPSFTNDVLLGLSATATGLNGVTNIFDTSTQQTLTEIYQVWYGIAPSYLRVWLKQPISTFVGQADQNISPTSTYSDIGFVDGIASPYDAPAQATQFFSLFKLAPRFAFANPAPWTVTPRMNFVVNRMLVDVLHNPTQIRAALLHKIPAVTITIGDPFTPTTFSNTPYAKVKPINPSVALLPNDKFAAALVEAGYLDEKAAAAWLAGGGAA